MFYYSQLSTLEKQCYEKMIESINLGKAEVRFPLMAKVDKIVTAVSYDHPEIFYVDFKRIQYVQTAFGIILNIRYLIRHPYLEAEIEKIQRIIQSVINKIGVLRNMDDYEKCKRIHNYLVRNVHYQYDAVNSPEAIPEAFDIRGVFLNSSAVCEGIAKAFKCLADKVGVKSLIAVGRSTLEGFADNSNHAWNIVKVNGKCAHIDVTWDLGLSENSKYIRYDYFFVPDKWIKSDHEYSDCPECNSEELSYFVRNNCIISGQKSLKKYISEKMAAGGDVLYFRFLEGNNKAANVYEKIQKAVMNQVGLYFVSGFTMLMVHNVGQNIVFFRIVH